MYCPFQWPYHAPEDEDEEKSDRGVQPSVPEFGHDATENKLVCHPHFAVSSALAVLCFLGVCVVYYIYPAICDPNGPPQPLRRLVIFCKVLLP